MYDILNKLNITESKQDTEAKKVVNESVQARGSIVAGVKSVEQKLREQFEAMKEGEKVAVKGGTVHKGTYGNEYDPGDDGTKKPKHVPKKGVKGRPKKEKPAEITAPKGDIFGRTTGKVPKGKKGVEVKGKAMSHSDNNKRDDEELDEVTKNPYAIGMAQAKKEIGLGKAKASGLPKKTVKRAHHIADVIKSQTNEGRRAVLTMLAEGVNFNEMMAERSRGIDELLSELQADIKSFKETGHCTDFLRDCMEVHGYGKKQLNDAARGPSFAPQHPGTPDPKPSFLDKAKAFGHKVLDKVGHGSDDELLSKLERETGGKRPNRYNEDAELNELARLAGLQVSEANDGNLANNAKPYDKVTRGDVIAGRLGKDEQGGKKEVDEADMEEGNEFSGALDAARDAGKKEFEVDGKTYPVKESQLSECGEMSPIAGAAGAMHQAEEQKGRISVNTSASSDGHKNVNISADGEAAEQLMAILKMAGLEGGQTHAQQAEIVITQEDKEKNREYSNSPHEEVKGMHSAETAGIAANSDDLHKQKDQHPEQAAKGDNPLTKKEKTVEDADPLSGLGAQLMAEYQSIKLQK